MATDTGFGKVRFFDDFLGDVITDQCTAATASSATAFAINAQVNGVIRGGSADDSSADISVIYWELNFQPNDSGPLVFECRIKPITSLSEMYFVGLSGTQATTLPINYNGGSLTTTHANCVGFYYAGGETSATWRYGGSATSVDSAHAAASSVFNPVLTEYQTFRIVVDIAGNASFAINGKTIAENVSACLTAGTSVTPFIGITDDGAAGSLDVDYVYVANGRS